jgi:uncharacterized protein (UPF0335 family)
MGQYEDGFWEIYQEVEKKGLREKFNKQIKKMHKQPKHDHKEPIEYWKYALERVKGWNPNKE